MERIAQTTSIDLLVDGTFALRRALDGIARPIAVNSEGAPRLAVLDRDEPLVRTDPAVSTLV